MTTLTAQKVEHMLWLAHRLSRARRKPERYADINAARLEQELIEEMRPRLIAILRLASKALRQKGSR